MVTQQQTHLAEDKCGADSQDRGGAVGNRPEVQDLARDDAWLGGLSLGQVIQKELAVTDHRVGPLPPLLHPRGLWDLQMNSDHVPLGQGGQSECVWAAGGSCQAPGCQQGEAQAQGAVGEVTMQQTHSTPGAVLERTWSFANTELWNPGFSLAMLSP